MVPEVKSYKLRQEPENEDSDWNSETERSPDTPYHASVDTPQLGHNKTTYSEKQGKGVNTPGFNNNDNIEERPSSSQNALNFTDMMQIQENESRGSL